MANMAVIGAARGLGFAVAVEADADGWLVTPADVAPLYDEVKLDVTDPGSVAQFFDLEGPFDSVVYTAGINMESSVSAINFASLNSRQMDVNFFGAMRCLSRWVRGMKPHELESIAPQHFVAVSSNSAHVARSKSLGYCASKAALSMGVRCAARELAASHRTIWAVEPGWLEGTSMSGDVEHRLHGAPGHRIPGDRTVPIHSLARFILDNINRDVRYLNGCTLRVDGSEQ